MEGEILNILQTEKTIGYIVFSFEQNGWSTDKLNLDKLFSESSE